MRRISPSAALAIAMLLAVAALVGLVPLLPGYRPYAQDLGASLLEPFESLDDVMYSLGTDKLGRDLLSRLALAGQVSLLISVTAVAISLTVGVTLGVLAGFLRGWVETAVVALADLQLSIPRVLLLIAVTAVMGPSLLHLTLLLGATSWVAYGRIARAMALSLREREFVLAAVTQGASPAWSMRVHLLPNILPQMLIVASFELVQVVVLESSLSYLGLGVQPPLPSWGLMVAEGQSYLELDPWLAVLPALALFMLAAGVQFLSQAFTGENAEAGR